jgi:hypothetical protein
VIPWRKISSPAAFLAGLGLGIIIARHGWDGINWWAVGLGLGTGMAWTVARPWWEHRAEWSEIIWGRRR